jgi:hypothetical protein
MIGEPARDLVRDRLALHCVSVEDRWRDPAVQRSGHQPSKVCRIGYPRIHSIPGMRNPQVCGVAANEHALVTKSVGHEAAAAPIFFRNYLVLKI